MKRQEVIILRSEPDTSQKKALEFRKKSKC